MRPAIVVALLLSVLSIGTEARSQTVGEVPAQPRAAWRAVEMNISGGYDGVVGSNVSAGLQAGSLIGQLSFGYQWFKEEYVFGALMGVLPGFPQPRYETAFASSILELG